MPYQCSSPTCHLALLAWRRHFWAKGLSDLGHDVRLISPQFVTPYVKSNKNDRNDAEAICEAVGRPNMRFVPVKSAEQLAVQRFIGFAVAWSLIASGSSIRSAVCSGARRRRCKGHRQSQAGSRKDRWRR
jgi:hypothetical protein